eukprot:COSAG02_NODE_15882_length_1133_cov_1.499033_1_plen_210_part_00
MARLALLLLFAVRASAQLSCAREEDLVANLRWVRKACEQEGEAFPEGDEDTLVPSTVTAVGCAEAVYRVTQSCGELLSRSPWFESRQSALAAAVESASAAGLLGEGVLLGSNAQRASVPRLAKPETGPPTNDTTTCSSGCKIVPAQGPECIPALGASLCITPLAGARPANSLYECNVVSRQDGGDVDAARRRQPAPAPDRQTERAHRRS